MGSPILHVDPPGGRLPMRVQALLEIALVSGLLSGFIASLPFALGASGGSASLTAVRISGAVFLDTAITLALLALILRQNGESLRDFGLVRKHWLRNAVAGLILAPLLLLLALLLAEGFRLFLPQYHLRSNPLIDLIQKPLHLILFLISSWVAGGFKEELQRAFILMRFGERLGGFRLGLVIWSLIFGAQHYLQGLQGMVTAALFGLVLGTLFLLRGNLVGPIVAHGAYDTTALLVYWYSRS
jgi:membrane protease YdiL (CAAX protease family)